MKSTEWNSCLFFVQSPWLFYVLFAETFFLLLGMNFKKFLSSLLQQLFLRVTRKIDHLEYCKLTRKM